MPSGRVKVFFPDRQFGFITTDAGVDVHVPASAVPDGLLRSGDQVEFELAEDENGGTSATQVSVTKQAAADNPVGRTMAAPPSWEELEERERQRRMARRRRR